MNMRDRKHNRRYIYFQAKSVDKCVFFSYLFITFSFSLYLCTTFSFFTVLIPCTFFFDTSFLSALFRTHKTSILHKTVRSLKHQK
jgi:hypothetical protein